MTVPIDLTCQLNADLHCHSIHSDGVLGPEDLVLRAKTNGVELWALTDHDDVTGVKEAAQVAHDASLPFITGVEISVTFAAETVHIVGLGVDESDAGLDAGLRQIRHGRIARAEQMAVQLERVGIKNALEGAMKYVGDPQSISRTHFSRYLVETGICRDNTEVFKKYLGTGRPGFVSHHWASLEQALGLIHDTGGVAVLAHPGRYKQLSATAMHALLTQFCALGGRGIEVITGSHSPADAVKYAQVAKDYNLLASRGSDFHGPQESRIDLGKLPLLGESLTPVWSVLADRIRY